MYVDENLNCVDCARQFIFSSGEQSFYEQKGFQNKPNRCPDCRQARKQMRGNGGGNGGGDRSGRPREMFTATCSGCGGVAEVPFNPRGDKPVYCRDCFASRPSHR
ncbi:MAG TPA: zinc-ribbon domain containing protein [Candidatus Baltobacteraceae bacterium]|nr:zinc-ribbon domain containing protein [Candidatus Baltobacteraceae bacterium]